ncbi:MAG: sodium:proton exchanger [Ignavibacteriales bacterium]|nr:MAG: sodium:proton exchanger [Ignavibacteriales bacterium]
MNKIQVIQQIVIILSVSLAIIFLFKRINLPSIPGFLIAGIIIGPHGLGLIKEISIIEAMAEIGVILLLFTIGLEVSVSKIKQLKNLILVSGSWQLFLTMLISGASFFFWGLELKQSIFLGLLVSISSTAIVLKLLTDKNEIDSPHGKFALSISIFQDLAFVPIIVIIPILSTSKDSDILIGVNKLLISFVLFILAVVIFRFALPKLLKQLAEIRLREAFTIGVILLILGSSYITESIGLSLALGAFIAGLILSETDFSHQVVADIIPLKDAFNSLFFVSIGLLLDVNYILQFPVPSIILTIGLIFIKALVIFSIIVFMKYPPRVGIVAGFLLAQVGEFSFVLIHVGMNYKIISSDQYAAFLTSSVATMLLTPVIYQVVPKLSQRLTKYDSLADSSMKKSKEKSLMNHVIIGGYGMNGKNLARVLKETGIKFIALELNPKTVREFKEKNENLIYGDITKREVLEEAGIKTASVICFLISDPLSTRFGIKMVKELNPKVHCIVRTRYINEVEELIKIGADEVIPEEFETSLQIFTKVLQKYHIPLNIVVKQANIIRQESYGMLRKDSTEFHPLSQIDKILAEGLTESYFVEESNPNLDKSIKELNIRALTGATIIAIIRNGITITNPSGKEVINSGDTLVLYGNHLSVDNAIALLNTGNID